MPAETYLCTSWAWRVFASARAVARREPLFSTWVSPPVSLKEVQLDACVSLRRRRLTHVIFVF